MLFTAFRTSRRAICSYDIAFVFFANIQNLLSNEAAIIIDGDCEKMLREGNCIEMILCRVLDNLIDYNEGTNSSNMVSEFVSPLNIAISEHHDNIEFNLGNGWSDINSGRLGFQVSTDAYAYQYTPVLTHSPANPAKYVSPVYAEVPNFIYINSFTTETSYKVGTHPTELDANMVNQVVGPFDQEENTIVITVKKEHRTTVN